MLISGLKEFGLYENTVIVLAGDHGYNTGEQGLWRKSTNFPTLGKMCRVAVPENLSGKDLNSLEKEKEYYAVSQFPRPYGALHKAN